MRGFPASSCLGLWQGVYEELRSRNLPCLSAFEAILEACMWDPKAIEPAIAIARDMEALGYDL
jgi:hypothetical protein